MAQNGEFLQKIPQIPINYGAIFNPSLIVLVSSSVLFKNVKKFQIAKKTILTLCEDLTTWIRIRTWNTDPDFDPSV